jgi:hypothetical protein
MTTEHQFAEGIKLLKSFQEDVALRKFLEDSGLSKDNEDMLLTFRANISRLEALFAELLH